MFFHKTSGISPFSKARAVPTDAHTFAFAAQDVALILAEWLQAKHGVRVRPDHVEFCIDSDASGTQPDTGRTLQRAVCTGRPVI